MPPSTYSRLLIVLLLMALSCVGGAVTISGVQNISNDSELSVHPRAAQDPAGNLHVVWAGDDVPRALHYVKGTWNGVSHTFGAVATIGNVGSYGYASPNIAVAPNGTVAVVWSENTLLKIWTWPSSNSAPSGAAVQLSTGGGIYPVITADSASRFHVVWDGDFQIQYVQWNAGVVERRDTFSPNSSTRPDIAVDPAGNVHLVWFGGGIKYRSRPAGGAWGSITSLDTGGNVAQIAADGLGNVHIAWSRDFDIQYVRRQFGTGNLETTTINSGDDLEPTLSATPSGKVMLVFRDSSRSLLRYATREGGPWSVVRDFMPGVQHDLSTHPYFERAMALCSNDWEIKMITINMELPPGTLVAPGATWKYFDSGAASAGWQARTFNDAAWPGGPAQLGFGEGDESTGVNSTASRVTTYFRHSFNVANPADFPQAKFRIMRDDGAVVYLNGTELFRTNLPAGAITSTTSAIDSVSGDEEGLWEEALVVNPPFVAGTNVLAVEVHQQGTTSSDLSFDLELRGVTRERGEPLKSGGAWTYLDNGSDPGATWMNPGFVPSGSWKAGHSPLGYGDNDEATVVEDNATAGYNSADTNRFISTYFRRTFLVPQAGEIGAAAIRFQRDDGIVVYLNGAELFRDNLPAGTITTSTPALSAIPTSDENFWLVRQFDPAKLVPGENTIAVEIHQYEPASSDISFDLEVVVYPHASLPKPVVTLAPATATLTWPAWAGAWVPAMSSDLGTWGAVPGTPVQNGQGEWQITVPRSGTGQFFRLEAP